MKITIIYDNTLFQNDLKSDWGFSCLVELENTPKILFDTGSNGSTLLFNMRRLGIDPSSIDEIFISHNHFDHVGGLVDFINVNNRVKVYVPPSFSGSEAIEVTTVKGPTKIHENVFSTGELEGIEQSMAIKTEKGVVLIVGCSHPGMINILGTANQFGRVYAIIGGLHGFSEFHLFKELDLICATHCTQHKARIKRLYPEKYVDGGAGKIIVL